MSTQRTIYNRVYVNGKLRRDWRVVSVTQRATLSTPGTAVIMATDDGFGNEPLQRWTPIKIYLDTRRRKTLAFTGYIWRRLVREGPGASEAVYECVDGRIHLALATCQRDYNVRSDKANDHDNDESHSAAWITMDIMRRFNTESSKGFIYNLYGIDKTDTGNEHNLRGVPVARALDDLVKSHSQYSKPRWRVEYLENSGTSHSHGDIRISLFGVGFGKPARVVLGSNPARSYKGQRGGPPNVSEGSQSQKIGEFFNRVYAYGDFARHQTALLLTPAWDTTDDATVQAVMKNRALYCQPKIGGQPNPYYKPGYEHIGRTYSIATASLWDEVTQAYTDQQPTIENFLAQNDGLIADPLTGAPAPHFVVVYGAPAEEEGEAVGAADYYPVFNGYSILQGKFVQFEKPQGSLAWDETEEDFVWTCANTMYLNCTIRDTERLTYDSGKIGSEPYTVVRRLDRPMYQYWKITTGWEINPDTGALTWQASKVIRNDTTKLTNYVTDYLREKYEIERSYRFQLPYFSLNYRIGQRLTSNYKDVHHASIMQIDYVCWSGGPVFDTYLTAMRGRI